MMKPDLVRAGLLIALSFAVPGLAVAQPAAGSTPVATRHGRVEERITDLRAKLRITPSEQPAFEGFAGVMRENADKADAMMQDRHKAIGAMNAVDQMKSYQVMAQSHLDDMQRLVPAFERLYESLSPEQRKLADTSFRDFAKSGIRGRG